ncbi:MAG: nucleoside triphosphate pyrophosphohydrolase, partial [Chloroflexi bacterium]|nr:nucleoside triphosphate pyrophosphohydrolase [Chloroflexota bacterium]
LQSPISNPQHPMTITLLGLGPGDPNLLTRQAWQTLEAASEIYLRTSQHPTLAGFPPGLQVHSFDHLYEELESFEEVYTQIVEQVLDLGRRPEGVIYAVPGHPFIAETTGPEIYRRAREAGTPIRVVEGLSFLEPVCTALGLDPFPHITLVDALELAARHHPPFPPDAPALIAQIYSPQIAAEVKLTLMNLYPDEYPVKLIHAAGTADVIVEDLLLYEIDRSPHLGLLTALYLPPLGPHTSFESLQEIVTHLRAPNGCPWDRKQTPQTMRSSLIEEAYEALAAIDAGIAQKMQEEFGDLLLVLTMITQIVSETGTAPEFAYSAAESPADSFNSAAVFRGVISKLIHRHPHVFGDSHVDGVDAVLKNWEQLKAQERKANGEVEKGLLDGVSIAIPALTQAQEFQSRAARVGFDWPEIGGVIDKVWEEWEEVRTAPDDDARAAELGDLLFALVNLTRWYDVDAESTLREANIRFRARFAHIEKAAREQGRELSELSFEEMDDLWEEAKIKR